MQTSLHLNNTVGNDLHVPEKTLKYSSSDLDSKKMGSIASSAAAVAVATDGNGDDNKSGEENFSPTTTTSGSTVDLISADMSSIFSSLSDLEKPLHQLAHDMLNGLTEDRSQQHQDHVEDQQNHQLDGQSESDEYCVVNSLSGDLYIISDKQVEQITTSRDSNSNSSSGDMNKSMNVGQTINSNAATTTGTSSADLLDSSNSSASAPLRLAFSSIYQRTSSVTSSVLEQLSTSTNNMKAHVQMQMSQMSDVTFTFKMPELTLPELRMAQQLRLRPSWNTSFSTAINLLRYAGANLPRNVQALRWVSDNGIPKWTPILPAGISCQESRYPPGEWYYPTVKGLNIRQNAQPESMSTGRFILYFHGGAFALCSTATHRGLLYRLARDTQTAIFSVDYRRPPEFPFPTPVDDCLSAYLYILEKVGDASRIIFAGDSAGGNLVLSTMLRIHELGLDMPAGGVLLSPWVDLDDPGESESWTVNSAYDYIDYPSAALFANLYKTGTEGNNSDMELRHSSLSPLYSKHLQCLPPLLVEFGACEVLRDQIQTFCEKCEALGNSISYHSREDMVHVFPIYAFTNMPQCQDSFRTIVKFVNQLLGEPEDSPVELSGMESSTSNNNNNSYNNSSSSAVEAEATAATTTTTTAAAAAAVIPVIIPTNHTTIDP